jgi:hypothetical protein
MDENIKKFIEIYSGLKRTYGYAKMDQVTLSDEGKLRPVYAWSGYPIKEQDYIDHLNGSKAIGIQPCDDEGRAKFGAIDIDDKQHSYKNFPFQKYLDLVVKYNLPVIPIKSKSGGLHLCVFFKEKVSALFIRNFFDKILMTLGLPSNIEIYPKETEIAKREDGTYEFGHFINLPYFRKEERLALNPNGGFFTFEQFIKVVELNLQTESTINEFTKSHIKSLLQGGNEEFEEGPPCLQILTKNKLVDGRDRFLYNYMVFAKKAYPDGWEEKVKEAARNYFEYDKNWDDKKVELKIRSWRKETKGHTCSEDPIKDFCIKSECIKRKFGILSDKKKKYPKISGLQKYEYPEPEYTFNIEKPDGSGVVSCRAKNIRQITNQLEMRNLIGNAAGFVPPMLKQWEYQESVIDILFSTKNKESIKPPKSATPEGILEQELIDWINGPEAKNDVSFKSGAVLFEKDEVYFKFTPFFDHIKNREWKETRLKTTELMSNLFEAKHDVSKRFPKKPTDKRSNAPIDVVVMPKKYFITEESNKQVVSMMSRDEIM